MNADVAGIDPILLHATEKPRTPLPLSSAIQRDLLIAFDEWKDAGCVVHPASIKGDKTPLSLPGCGRENADGTRAWGWGAVRDGQKPMLTRDQFGSLVRGGRTDGLCVLLPSDSRLAMLELEAVARPLLPRIVEEARTLGVYDVLLEIIEGYTEESTRGGLHFPFRVSSDVPTRRQVLARLRTPDGEMMAAEVIGAGLQFVAAPSCGRTHENGRPYTLLYGGPSSIKTITIDEQRLIYAAFASINEVPPKMVAERRPDFSIPQDDVASDFNRRGSWENILKPAGWKKCSESPVANDGRTLVRTYWSRPGKRNGVSASTLGGTLCCFSSAPETRLPTFDPYGDEDQRRQDKQTKFQVYAALHHGGDHDAAKSVLRQQGFGRPDYMSESRSEQAEVERLAQAIGERLADGSVSLVSARELVPAVVSQGVLLAAANRERSGTGRPLIKNDSSIHKKDPRLRSGFTRLLTAAIRILQANGSVTFDRSSQTLFGGKNHG